MLRIRDLLPLACSLLAALVTAASAEPPPEAAREEGFVASMGQPPRFKPYAGLAAGAYRPAGGPTRATGLLTLGAFVPISNPIAALGLAAEGYVAARGDRPDGGVRALVGVRPLRLQLGLDLGLRDLEPDLIVSSVHPLWRGGPFGLGGRLRIDWLPTRGHTFQVGLEIPIGQRFAGRTRPSSDRVALQQPQEQPGRLHTRDRALAEALANVRHGADWINRFSTPFFDPNHGTRGEVVARVVERIHRFRDHLEEADALHPGGHTYERELLAYHQELDRAFTLAASRGREGRRLGEATVLGQRISARARESLLDEVLLPYDRTLGRIKRQDTTRGLGERARETFAAWLEGQSDVDPADHRAILHVFQTVLDVVEENREGSARYWRTSQLVWLPLQLALRPEQHDEAAELDALIERAVGEPFTTGNRHYYLVGGSFQRELERQISRAEVYHVLWIHDYRGRNGAGEPDRIGFETTLAYLDTLTRRVERYDETRRLPVFLILLDQNFYEANDGRLWLTLLEDPLRHELSLPASHAEMEERLRESQAALRAAVAGSSRLRAERASGGEEWLRNRVKVHVNITHPVDWSFWSRQVIPLVGIPDVLMRDHRKIAFYDVTEADPWRGEAIFTGMGVGEHYVGPTWDDRAMTVSGPAILPLKAAARELLETQGFEAGEIPPPLRPASLPRSRDTTRSEPAGEDPGFRALHVHNRVGYGPKPINVLKAALYSLMPRGSFLIVPDSLWNSPFWAGMLMGAALRGLDVVVVAPALENAPSSGFPQISRSQEIFAEMILARRILGDAFARAGGSLHTGIYDVDVDVGDLEQHIRLYYDRVTDLPLLDEFTPPEVLEDRAHGIEQRILERLEEEGYSPAYLATDAEKRRPQLHLKAQLFVTAQGRRFLSEFVSPEVHELFALKRAREAAGLSQARVREIQEEHARVWRAGLRDVTRRWSREKVARLGGYLTVGSHNMDYRGMMMDGEVLYVTSGEGLFPALPDFMTLLGSCTWISDLEELHARIPEYSEWRRQVGRLIKYAL